jgi:hypothetical protein
MAQRIKGQDNELVLLTDGVPTENLMARSTELRWKLEILQEGYLGETTDRYDTIFKGIGGRMELHFDSPAMFELVERVVDKARRRTPGTRFNLKSTLNFPSGRRGRLVVPDLEWGEIPMAFGSRSDFGTITLEFAASEAFSMPL